MIDINGRLFAKTNNEFVDTVFKAGGTAVGYYRKTKRKILLMRLDKKPFAAIINNPKQNKFAVSCAVQDNGRIWYMQALDGIDSNFLGFDKISYNSQISICDQLFNGE